MTTFDEYWKTNPRQVIPDDMQSFVEYAAKRYGFEDADDYGVNGHHNFDDEDEVLDEVENYLGDSMEALLLFQEYLQMKEREE